MIKIEGLGTYTGNPVIQEELSIIIKAYNALNRPEVAIVAAKAAMITSYGTAILNYDKPDALAMNLAMAWVNWEISEQIKNSLT